MEKVYIVMIHTVGENPWVHSVWSTREKATNTCNVLNALFRTKRNENKFADFISEEVDKQQGKENAYVYVVSGKNRRNANTI